MDARYSPHRSSDDFPQTVGYDRVELERYLAACADARARLQCEIADAHARLARARSALDAHRMLSAMLESAVDEITAKRRQADIVVGRLIARPTTLDDGVEAERVAELSAARPAAVVPDRGDLPISWQPIDDPLGSLVHQGEAP